MNEIHLRVLKVIEQNSTISQHKLADELGVSLGKANYCLKALLDKGLVKAKKFKNRKNKLAYSYFLTPKGIEEKSTLAYNFLKRKMNEFELLKAKIADLKSDLNQNNKKLDFVSDTSHHSEK